MLQRSIGNRAVRRQARTRGGDDPGGTATMHASLADAWRCRHGFAPGTGPSDSAIVHGGLIADPLMVDLQMTTLQGTASEFERDVDYANTIWESQANIRFRVVNTTILGTDITNSVLGADNTLDCNHAHPPTSEESALIAAQYAPGMINVYYVPHLAGCNDLGFTMQGATPDPVIIMDDGLNVSRNHTLAHELGHALGLPHDGGGDRLMHDGLGVGNDLTCDERTTARGSSYAHAAPAATPVQPAAQPPQPQPPQPQPPQPQPPQPQPAVPPSPAGSSAEAPSPATPATAATEGEAAPRVTLQIPISLGAFALPVFGSTSIFVPTPAGQRPVTDAIYQPNIALGINYSFHRGPRGWELGLFGQAGENVAIGATPPPHLLGGSSRAAGFTAQAFLQPTYVAWSSGPHQFALVGQLGAGHTSSDVPLVTGGTIDSSATGISAAVGGQYSYSFVPNVFQFNASLLGGAGFSILDARTPPAGVDRTGVSGILSISIGFQFILPVSWYSRGR
jgi:hypothetical protein